MSNHLSFSPLHLPLLLVCKRRTTRPRQVGLLQRQGHQYLPRQGKRLPSRPRASRWIVWRQGWRGGPTALSILGEETPGIYPRVPWSPDVLAVPGQSQGRPDGAEADVPHIPVAMIDTEKIQPRQAVSRSAWVGINVGSFRWTSPAMRAWRTTASVPASTTDEIMYELGGVRLSTWTSTSRSHELPPA